jgi:signal transduction histidine kinase
MSSLAMLNLQLAQVGRLLTGIVHEIRGPLAVIRGNAELLRLKGACDDEGAQWVESILRSTNLLQLRLEHLMATVRNSSSNTQLLDIRPLLSEAVDLFVKGLRPGEQQVKVETAFPTPVPQVRGDAGRLMQVLLNLLNNAHEAVSRTHGGGRILLHADTTAQAGRNWVTVDVIDDGPGVPEVYIDRIFEPFFTTREDGTGYGLYLASEIVREQSGQLTVRNNSDGGATFTIWLPVADSEVARKPGTANSA